MSNPHSTRKQQLTKNALAFAITAALSLQAAQAQEESAGDLEEVLVTATKRVVALQDVPLAVTAISGDVLVDMQIDSILSLEKAVPGLTLAGYGNNPQAVIRGAGTAGTTDIAVPIYHNGMYLPTYGQALAGYVDIERVEVLRGPQGTLFGRNTYGGLINVITKRPETEEFDAGGAVSVGDYSLLRLEGFVNVPLGDTVAMRITAVDEQRDPYVKNVVNPKGGLKDSDYTYVRGQLLWQPTENLSINFGATYWKDTANGNLNYSYKAGGIPLDRDDPTRINAIDGWLEPRMGIAQGCGGDRPGGRIQAGNICTDESAAIIDGAFRIDLDSTPQRELEDKSIYVNVDWDIPNHLLQINAAQFDYSMIQMSDADFSRNPGWWDGNYSNSKTQQLDLILTSMFAGPLEYTAGFYYFDSQDNANTSAYMFASLEESWYGYAGATPETPSWAYWNTEGRGGTESYAFYGQADYRFADKWTGTLGLRYSNDDRRSQGSNGLPWDASQRLATSFPPAFPTFNYDGRDVNKGSDSNVDYRVGLRYEHSNDLMFYGSFATAYIAGGTDVVTQNLLDPQTNETLEFGMRSTMLDGDLTFNATVYDAQYDGLNTTKFEYPGGSDVAVAIQVPGGSISSRGLEIEGFWTPMQDLTVDFGINFEDSEYDEFIVGAGNLIWNGEAPIGSEVIGGEAVFVMDGKSAAYSPDMTVGVGLRYDIDLGDMGSLTPYAHIYYNSGYESNRAPVFFGEQDAYTDIDLSLGWASASGDWTARLWMTNSTDELIKTYTEIFSRARVGYDYKAPRMWGLRVGYNF
ncbi:MAG: TonB-dependent receptor [Xanthomonadales bacterium]|jgi:iron complex outermembrane receptor protein|nr:TonB-dependent receptor [Xanthomonadales bacterium]